MVHLFESNICNFITMIEFINYMGLAYKLRISVTYSENLVKIQITGNYQVLKYYPHIQNIERKNIISIIE